MIKEKIQEIKHARNTFWIGMGDYADCIIKEDKRFDMHGLAPWVVADNIVESQRVWLNELFKPIAGKCLGLITGNHEEMIHSRYQIDFTRNLCEDLDVPYAGYSAYFLLKFHRSNTGSVRQYKIHAWHGAGAAQTEGARLMRLMRLVNEFTARIYFMGHLHARTTHTPDRMDVVNGRLKHTNLIATITGSWLTTYTQPRQGDKMGISYGEKFGYKPSDIGCPVIHIQPDRDQVTIES